MSKAPLLSFINTQIPTPAACKNTPFEIAQGAAGVPAAFFFQKGELAQKALQGVFDNVPATTYGTAEATLMPPGEEWVSSHKGHSPKLGSSLLTWAVMALVVARPNRS